MGTVKKQKRARTSALKNRYYAGAKLSEHKFLRILHGFAEGMTIQELEKTTHVSGKTIRTTYRALRTRLAEAVFEEPEKFGGAGLLLADDTGNQMLSAVAKSTVMRRNRKRHAPRMSCPIAEQALISETLVRLVCTVDLRHVEIEERVIEALALGITQLRPRHPLQRLAAFIPGARPHAHPSLQLYGDYRRYLLKNSLRTQ